MTRRVACESARLLLIPQSAAPLTGEPDQVVLRRQATMTAGQVSIDVKSEPRVDDNEQKSSPDSVLDPLTRCLAR